MRSTSISSVRSIRSRSSARIRIVDAVDLDAIEPDHDIAGQQPGLRRRPVRFDLRQQRAHLVVDAGDHRMPSGIGAVWPDTPI